MDNELETTVATDGIGVEETQNTPETPAPEEGAPSADAAAPEVKPELSLPEKLAAKKAAIDAGKPVTPGEKAPDGAVEGYKPNLKFKVLDKEHEIPKEFQGLVKDEKSEKMVRELFEKSYGLDSVKAKAVEVRGERDTLARENAQIKSGIDGLRNVYQGAVKSGNWLKLDDFFAGLKIPTEHVMQYVLAKVKLNELPPEQRQAIEGQMESDRQRETMEQQFQRTQGEAQTQAQQLKSLQLDFALAKPDVKTLAEQYDAQVGKPGAFKQRVIDTGLLHWHTRRVDMTPDQAAAQVIADFGLKVSAPSAPAPAATEANGNALPPEKRVIQRETKTIPNIQGRSSSPLKTKPKSIEDLKKLREAALSAEA